jgi:GMP synthase (glutamine-hydrolysing)
MIYIVDFGSQTTHLINRRIERMGVPTKILTPLKFNEAIFKKKPSGIILSGGPSSVTQKNSPTINPKVFKMNIPILGICYGLQLTTKLLKGEVISSNIQEFGPAQLNILKESKLFQGIPKKSMVWMSHGDRVERIPKGFHIVARTKDVPIAAISNESKKIYGIQFHPEVSHTKYGEEILKNFIAICGFGAKESKVDIQSIVDKLQEEMLDGNAICGVSGGIDSTVAAILAAKAIGRRLKPVYIESGLMRVGTKDLVKDIFKKHVGINVKVVRAKGRFLKKLKGVTDPEQKRKIIGNLYVELFEEEAKRIQDVKYLIQGTIYSDVIESKGSKHADKIKSHHNVGGLPKNMNLKVVEPLREFYKDEVRLLGQDLNLPKEIVFSQPFPGPGQAIRILGEITNERLKKQQLADKIVIEEFKRFGWYEKVFQCFPVMTEVNSTAVKGDSRRYAEVVAIRAYESKDVMTSSWAYLSKELLQSISSRIVNEVPDVSRVVYDITTKPPATMEWE